MKLRKVVEDSHEEGGMARGQLERAIDYATMLRDRIDSEDELPSWVQSKITKSMDYLQSVYNYMDGKDGIVEGKINEAKYKLKDGKIHISKADFKKIHKDYKKATKGKEMMLALDPKSGETRLFPVVLEGRHSKITRKEMAEIKLFTEKNVPNDKKKWAASIAAAKRKFKVYPSAYANAWAAKNYKSKGGTWRKTKG